MDYNQLSLEAHRASKGKIQIVSKMPVTNMDELSIAYTPGVAQPCLEIAKDENEVYTYTSKSNTVAVISDGSAVLGLGNIGPKAALPVMEGKCVLFREFGGVDAFPICLDTQDTEEIIKTVVNIAPVFGGMNLEDISAPRCFEIEARLDELLDIPVFHDDQHGTAIVVCSALTNALKLKQKTFPEITVAISGAGAAGVAITKMLLYLGVSNIYVSDSKGIISKERDNLDSSKKALLALTNPDNRSGSLADALKGADVFIGVSAPGIVTKDMVASMNRDPILLPMANPTPEIMPNLAYEAGAFIVGTGRSDFPNQINNVLAFPGIFRGALDVGAKRITEKMKLAAVEALSSLITPSELSPNYIIPKPFDKRIVPAIASAVAKAYEA
jgi:malate dehydrogenase (oxaloacetate-decarboxylating)